MAAHTSAAAGMPMPRSDPYGPSQCRSARATGDVNILDRAGALVMSVTALLSPPLAIEVGVAPAQALEP
jgi:hypothetical protein